MSDITHVITGKVRFSYANIWEPKSINGSKLKYSVALIISKSDAQTVDKIKAAIEAAKEKGYKMWNNSIPFNLKLPLRDGDLEHPGDKVYENSYWVNANADLAHRPTIVDAKRQQILDQSEVYSGCYGRASITFYPFNASGNRGVACGLNNIQKLSDGEPLGGGTTPEEDFADEFGDFLS